MKKVYFVQPSYHFDDAMYFPYAVGSLIAYAWKNEDVAKSYVCAGILHLREDPGTALCSIDEPFLVAFSNYLWNYEYNKKLAAMVRKKYPECIIVFGGHQLPEDGSTLDECPAADLLIFGEGEEVFTRLLIALDRGEEISSIPNLTFRSNDGKINTERCPVKTGVLPSPYLEGVFDGIISQFPNANWSFFLETNRGCPYRCAYCDWGHIPYCDTQIPLERVFADLDWLAAHNIEFCAAIDANFGILDRDEDIIDYILELNRKTGYPKKFQASYAKNKPERIYSMSKKLDHTGMNKGVTLAFQTMSPVAAENIGRKNISIESFGELIHRYAADNIPTYTELILGMPGETTESFVAGLDTLLNAGQHGAIYVYNCEWLMQSAMGDPDYIKKFDLGFTVLPFCFSHMVMENNGVTEYSRIITSTYSMPHEAWVEMNLFSYTVQCFHSMGILKFFALYLHYEHGTAYRDFYSALLKYLLDNPDSIAGGVFREIKENLHGILSSSGSISRSYEQYGEILWTYEEYCYLEIVRNKAAFFEEISGFLYGFGIDGEVFENLLEYQENMLKAPFDCFVAFESSFDFTSYFKSAMLGKRLPLKRESRMIELKATGIESLEKFAIEVVWHGRRPGRNLYFNDPDMMTETLF